MPNRKPVCSGNSDSQGASADAGIINICWSSLANGSSWEAGQGALSVLSAEPREITPSSGFPVWAALQWHVIVISQSPRQVGERSASLLHRRKSHSPEELSSLPKSRSRVVAKVEIEMKLGAGAHPRACQTPLVPGT